MESYLIGTLFEEEEKEKKQNFFNQIARDEKGHKRFHGAFTGGFQAGYKNTCGSKDGWVPSQFVSSRNNRAKYQPQSILQFMDEEDLGRTVVGENLIANQEYSDTLGLKAKEEETLAQRQAKDYLGMDIPNELIITTKQTSIGLSILKAMRQSGNQTNNRIIGAAIPEKKPEFDQMTNLKFKDDRKGLGYEDHDQLFEENDWFSEQFAALFRKAKADKPESLEEDQENRIKNRIHFSSFKDEIEEEDYSNFEITHDDMEKLQILKKNLNSQKKIRKPLDGFVKSSAPYVLPLHKSSFEIPPDYNPFYRLTIKPKDPSYKPSGFPLTLDERKALLEGKDSEAHEKPLKKVSEETKQKILNMKHFVKGSAQDMQGDHIESMFKNKDKQARYLNYCYEKEGKVVGGIPPAFTMTHDQLQAEIKEFDQIYEMFKHYKKEGEKEVKKETKFEHRRTVQQWVPDKLVCKRFGVPQPFQGKLAPLNQQKALIEKRNLFESQIQPLFESGKRKLEETQEIDISEEGDEEDEVIKKKIKGEEMEENKVSLELFKSIFDTEDD